MVALQQRRLCSTDGMVSGFRGSWPELGRSKWGQEAVLGLCIRKTGLKTRLWSVAESGESDDGGE